MVDLIDRQMTIDAVRSYYDECDEREESIEERIAQLPSAGIDLSGFSDKLWKTAYERGKADAVRHGHWIIKDNPGTGWYRVTCSECGEDVTSVAPVIGFFPKAKVIWDFCPECGTRMDGE